MVHNNVVKICRIIGFLFGFHILKISMNEWKLRSNVEVWNWSVTLLIWKLYAMHDYQLTALATMALATSTENHCIDNHGIAW